MSNADYPETIMKKADFQDAVSRVSYAARSLASCKSNEIPNEANILRHARNQLCAARPARKSPALEQSRRSAMDYANEVMRRRCA